MSSQRPDAIISVRIVVIDNYLAPVSQELNDPQVSHITGKPVTQVPLIRIFGHTPVGQTVCAHVHGVAAGGHDRARALGPRVLRSGAAGAHHRAPAAER